MIKNKIISYVFISILFLFLLNILMTLIISYNNKTLDSMRNKKKDYTKFFPFLKDDYLKKNIQKETLYDTVSLKLHSLSKFLKKIDKSASSRVPFRYKFCEFHGAISKFIGVRLFPDLGTIELENNYLCLISKYNLFEPLNIKEAINNIVEFNNYLKDKYNKIDFLYIQYPNKISKFDDHLPLGITDDRNKTSDEIIRGLKDKKIDCLDLRNIIKEQNLHHHELFLKTDHHWKTETGLWASKEICKYFEKYYEIGFDYSLLSKHNYTFRIIKKAFLGSAGRKLTLGFTNPDNITIAYPNFLTNLTFNNLEKTISGSFKDVFVDEEKISLAEKYNYYEKDYYNFYRFNPFFIVENNFCKNNITCLFIVDSYQEVVTPFLALMVKKLIIISPREFDGSIKCCIDYYKPNIICVAQTSRLVEQDKTKINWKLFKIE